MKQFLLIIPGIIIACAANAQSGKTDFNLLAFQPKPANTINLSDQVTSNFRVKDERHWKKLKTAGIIFTSFGAACVAGGIYFISEDKRRNGAGSEGFGVAIGSAGIIGGTMALGGGVAMLLIANKQLKKIRNTSISTTSAGTGLALHF